MECRRWPTSIAAIACLLWIGLLLPLAGPAEASCAAPDISATPSSAPAGSTILVTGKHFASGCNDAIACQVGQPCPTPPPSPPSRNIDITFVQDGRTWHLARVNADDRYRFAAEVRVPDDADPGRARIVAEGQWRTSFVVGLPRTGEVEIYRTTRIVLIASSAALATLTLGALLRTRSR